MSQIIYKIHQKYIIKRKEDIGNEFKMEQPDWNRE